MSENLRIALDVMGGDNAPAATVAGAVLAAARYSVEVALVGPEEVIRQELARHSALPHGLTIVNATQVITMGEHPAQAVRAKPDSSLVVAMKLVKQREAQAFVSVGNTGAALAAGLLILGRIKGVERPALGALMPRPATGGATLIVDAGANAECRPAQILQFAIMASAYLERVVGIAQPRIGLLNIGEEETKGNAFTQEVYGLLRRSRLNFVGNVEGRDIMTGSVDAIITDGFTGNVLIKTVEGVAEMLGSLLRQSLRSHWYNLPAALALSPTFRAMGRKLDYSEYGGVPLLGVDGVAIIGHGRSDAKAVASSIRVAAEAARAGIYETLRDLFAEGPELIEDGEDTEKKETRTRQQG